MKSALNLICFSFFCISSSFAFAGSETRNGGDVVICGDGKKYSLDYVLAGYDSNLTLAKVIAPYDSLFRIQKLIDQKLPELSESFTTYINSFTNTDITVDKPYIWVNSEDDLPDIQDEDIRVFPKSCTRSGPHAVLIKQAVIRTRYTGDPSVIFYTNDHALEDLDSMQLSFVLVHEWLWNFTDRAVINRQANYFLHSAEFDAISADEAKAYLQKIGIFK